MATKRDFETLAMFLADSAWRTQDTLPEIQAHYRYVVVAGLACKKMNPRFDERKWIAAAVPESWRGERLEDVTKLAVDALSADAMRIWDENAPLVFERIEDRWGIDPIHA